MMGDTETQGQLIGIWVGEKDKVFQIGAPAPGGSRLSFQGSKVQTLAWNIYQVRTNSFGSLAIFALIVKKLTVFLLMGCRVFDYESPRVFSRNAGIQLLSA